MSFLPGMFPAIFAAAGGGTPAETGFTLVGAGASVDTGGSSWGSPGNITADDGSPSTTGVGTGAGGVTSDTLRGSALGFAVPGGATINGIEVRVQVQGDILVATLPNISYVNVGKDNSTLGTAKTPATATTTSYVNYTYGSSSDLWGLSWTPAEINASTFQGLIRVNDPGTASQADCDAMWINVHYTV